MYHDIDFSKIEDSSFEDRFYVGFQGLESDGQGFQAVYNHIFVKTGEIVSIALFVVILSIHQPLIAFICIVTILISSLSNYLYSNYSHKK